jgi:O-antigen/teichoic acid export membrane protein
MSVSRNAVYNFAGAAIPVFITILTLPTYLKTIGNDRYGALATAWIITGYFSLLDLGLGRSVAKAVSSTPRDTNDTSDSLVWSAVWVSLISGLIGSTIFIPIAYWYFSSSFSASGTVHQELIHVIPWLCGAIPLLTLNSVVAGAMEGFNRFGRLNLIQVSSGVCQQLIPIGVATIWPPSLSIIVPSIILIRLLALILMLHACLKQTPNTTRFRPHWETSKSLLRYGGWVTVSNALTPLMVTLDKLMIASLAGAKSVTQYTVPYNMVSAITMLPNSLSSALFPHLASSDSTNSRLLAADSIRTLLGLITPLAIVGILLMGPFLEWWISPEFANTSTQLGQILLVGMWAHSLAYIPYAQLQARGRPDLVALCHAVELPLYLFLLFVSMREWGITGAAFAWSIRATLDAMALYALSRPSFCMCKMLMGFALPLVTCATLTIGASKLGIFQWTAGALALIGCFGLWWYSAPKRRDDTRA